MKLETTLDEMKQSFDWQEAFNVSPTYNTMSEASDTEIALDDVSVIFASVEGDNDGPDWLAIGKVTDGRYFVIEAGCCYTGWDCNGHGTIHVSTSWNELITMAMDNSQRDRLGIPQP